jgi:hypothetical protein
MKNTMQFFNAIGSSNNWLNQAIERISVLKDRTFEITQPE